MKNLRTKFVALATITLGVAVAGGLPVAAAPSNGIVYSTDGGATWTSSPTVAPGGTVLARVYYDNDTADNLDGAQVQTTIPTEFTLVPGSTRVCLNPGTTDPTTPTDELACNTDAGQGGAIDEGAVWAGQTLTIAPNAGVYGQPTDATSGLLASGTVRYLNLHSCSWAASENYSVAVSTPSPSQTTGTDVSNTADTSLICGSGPAGYALTPGNSGFKALDLLGNRYVNLHSCDWAFAENYSTAVTAANPGQSTGTATSNTADTSLICGPGPAGYTLAPGNSGFQALDLLDNRYINLHHCDWAASENYSTLVSASAPNQSTGTNASNTADTGLVCGSGPAGYSLIPGNSGFASFDTLDTTRGQGFVEFAMTAPSPENTTSYPENAALVGPGTGDPSSNGNITVIGTLEVPMVGSWPVALGAIGLAAGGGWLVVHRQRRRALPA